MSDQEPSTAGQTEQQVGQAALPPESCATCGCTCDQGRSLYAICARAERDWETLGGGFVGGTIAGIPFFFPTPGTETIETRVGRDTVVPIPLRACDARWQELEGGFAGRLFAFLSQVMLTTGLVMVVVWLVSKVLHQEVPIFYAFACFIGFVPFYAASEWVQSKWSNRLSEYLVKVPEYARLLSEFPDTEIVIQRPVALDSGDAPAQP